jgi:hypothetical protein
MPLSLDVARVYSGTRAFYSLPFTDDKESQEYQGLFRVDARFMGVYGFSIKVWMGERASEQSILPA